MDSEMALGLLVQTAWETPRAPELVQNVLYTVK